MIVNSIICFYNITNLQKLSYVFSQVSGNEAKLPFPYNFAQKTIYFSRKRAIPPSIATTLLHFAGMSFTITAEELMAEIKEFIEDENKIGTVIGEDIEFKGKLTFKESLKIKGSFEGKIETDGHLIIGREAVVNADVTAKVVSVDGTINGKIKARELIELFGRSRTMGDLITPDLSIENKSIFNGTCIMSDGKKRG
jgi:cytoskeletal protein CcmA (bactofilin family)